MKRIIIIFTITMFSIAWAEPSVYSRASYSDAETLAKKNRSRIASLKQQVAQLREEIEGMKSIIDGISNQLATMQQQKQQESDYTTLINQLSDRIARLENSSSTSSRAGNTANNGFSNRVQKSSQSGNVTAKAKTEKKKSSATLYKEAVLAYGNKRYTQAKKSFETLLNRNYKKASSHFYLGEIAYKRGKYARAINHYQKSAKLDENAAYMDRLLLHTAIALDKSGEHGQAKRFYQAIIEGYPNSSSAKAAKKHLK